MFVVGARNEVFVFAGDMGFEILDYIFCITIEQSATVTDFRALLYTCTRMRLVIKRFCRSRIPDNCIMNKDSDVTGDIKMAVL